MRKIIVDLAERSYPIYIGSDLLSSHDLLGDLIKPSQIMIVTNTTIESLYLPQVMQALSETKPKFIIIPDGEMYKTLDTMNNIITELIQNRFGRDSCLIALGGGVVGDITGFAAACYQRGIQYFQLPTTLLAQVDASVGGKTAVNHQAGKNMIGAFHQPAAVVIDVKSLTTLPDRELNAGFAEIIKYGLICDSEFFSWVELNIDKLKARDFEALEFAIERSCQNKAKVVTEDEKENGLRAILNFGHTFGHAIETGMEYKEWLHGEAVSVGMCIAAEISCKLGWLDEKNVNRIKSLLKQAELPITIPETIGVNNIKDTISIDKKSRKGKLFLVLLRDIGHAIVTDEFDNNLLDEVLFNFASVAGGK